MSTFLDCRGKCFRLAMYRIHCFDVYHVTLSPHAYLQCCFIVQLGSFAVQKKKKMLYFFSYINFTDLQYAKKYFEKFEPQYYKKVYSYKKKKQKTVQLIPFFLFTKGSLQQLLIAPDVYKVLSYCKDFTPNCDTPLPYAPFLNGAAQQRNQPSVQVVNNVRYVSGFIPFLCVLKCLPDEYPCT